jgi:serine/tyrosine/threonine adenylyltransferase
MTHTSQQTQLGWNLDNSYARLPDVFFEVQNPVPVRKPKLIIFNTKLAETLGLDAKALNSHSGAEIFAGNTLPEGSQSIAQAYAGHQFGYFTMLGDGRAVLLGEQVTTNGERFDIQLKGSGQTPFSRRGDGRAVIGPMLREYIISEALHALGIPTTRSLAVVETGEPVHRETTLPGAILTRVASSHIRVGTFEYIARRAGEDGIRELADYAIQRHYPEVKNDENPYLGFFEAIVERQAKLIVQWQLVGFIHGVMNTDNMSICGESIDFGPCAFMDIYDPRTVFSSIDKNGRYAYNQQPFIAQWNLTRLAETLLPIIHPEQNKAIEMATEIVNSFGVRNQRHWLNGMRAKLGLFTEESGDKKLVDDLLSWMETTKQDFTETFRALSSIDEMTRKGWFKDDTFQAWHHRWQERLSQQPQSNVDVQELMSASNPVVIPRNHRVESALKMATETGNLEELHLLLKLLANPYSEHPEDTDRYLAAPEVLFADYRTFCGT